MADRLAAGQQQQVATRTPVEVLRRLQPDLFVKGGDYADRDLPEASVMQEWGGEAVVVSFLQGRSTTRLIERALADAR